MAIFQCSQCGYERQEFDASIGQKVNCPQCSAVGLVTPDVPAETEQAKDSGLLTISIDKKRELDNLSPQQCFVLGYELADIDHLLKGKDEIQRPVHACNRERIAKSCADARRSFKMTWTHDDPSEGWLWLVVYPS